VQGNAAAECVAMTGEGWFHRGPSGVGPCSICGATDQYVYSPDHYWDDVAGRQLHAEIRVCANGCDLPVDMLRDQRLPMGGT